MLTAAKNLAQCIIMPGKDTQIFHFSALKMNHIFFVSAAKLKQRIEKVYARNKGEKEDLNHFGLMKSSV